MLSKILYYLLVIIKYAIKDFKEKYVYQIFIPYPKVINLNANDICNSKCVMCNIWKQEPTYEMSPNEFSNIFQNKLFGKVEHVGITGGEPTLRKDLPSIFEAACNNLPNLKGLSMITNCIEHENVISQITRIKDICDTHNINFSVMVSLDGYGVVHDQVRRVVGNFESAMNVITHVKNLNIPLTIGSTISRTNIWEVDNLLDFLKSNNLNGRFRIAEFINRLYNENLAGRIRSFNDEETYHLSCFFKKLELTYEQNILYKRTYQNIISMLNGSIRKISCPYKSNGIVLNARSELAYCAPKSKVIGKALLNSSYSLYKKNISERKRIIKNDCDNCIHDYHDRYTLNAKYKELKYDFFKKIITIERIGFAKYFKTFSKFSYKKTTFKSKQVFITGWYGTETVGDKAILGNIFDYYTNLYDSQVEFVISSLYSFITNKTIKELNVNAKVIDCNSYDFIKEVYKSDVVVMGGGPLMDIDELALPLWAFTLAKHKKNITTHIFGCGLGPLKTKINVVKTLLETADIIWLRDNKSIIWAKEISSNTKEIILYGDPAKKYIKNRSVEILPKVTNEPYFALFLREWTYDYSNNLTPDTFETMKNSFDKNISYFISEICKKYSLKAYAYPMHTFTVGKDDRDYYRYLKKEYLSDVNFEFHKFNSSVDETISVMQGSALNITMRFHSVLFAHTLGTNFFPIDYTNGGKINSFLNDEGYRDKLFDFIGFSKLSKPEITALVNKLTINECTTS